MGIRVSENQAMAELKKRESSRTICILITLLVMVWSVGVAVAGHSVLGGLGKEFSAMPVWVWRDYLMCPFVAAILSGFPGYNCLRKRKVPSALTIAAIILGFVPLLGLFALAGAR